MIHNKHMNVNIITSAKGLVLGAFVCLFVCVRDYSKISEGVSMIFGV